MDCPLPQLLARMYPLICKISRSIAREDNGTRDLWSKPLSDVLSIPITMVTYQLKTLPDPVIMTAYTLTPFDLFPVPREMHSLNPFAKRLRKIYVSSIRKRISWIILSQLMTFFSANSMCFSLIYDLTWEENMYSQKFSNNDRFLAYNNLFSHQSKYSTNNLKKFLK